MTSCALPQRRPAQVLDADPAPLRVALIASATYAIRQPFAGGLEAHTWALARGLRRRGHDVTVFAGAGCDPELAVSQLTPSRATLSAAARADVSMAPSDWLQDHHAYLQLMMELAAAPFSGTRRPNQSSSRNPVRTNNNSPPPRALARAGLAITLEGWPPADSWPGLLEAALAEGGARWPSWAPGDGASRAAAMIESVASRGQVTVAGYPPPDNGNRETR